MRFQTPATPHTDRQSAHPHNTTNEVFRWSGAHIFQEVVGLALEPQITVKVNIDSNNAQVRGMGSKTSVL